MFGKRKTPWQGEAAAPEPPPPPPARRRIFAEHLFTPGPDGIVPDHDRFHPDDPRNILLDTEALGRRVKDAKARQDARQAEITNDLRRLHGHAEIMPYFILGEGVFFNAGELGYWLAAYMDLTPYDDWNILYLPMDRQTQAAMGGLPLHPRRGIAAFEKTTTEMISGWLSQYKDAKQKLEQRTRLMSPENASRAMADFITFLKNNLPAKTRAYAEQMRKLMIQAFLNVERAAAQPAAAAPPQRQPDEDGRRRAFGKATFEGERGQWLRDMGLGPDHPSNVIPGEADFATKLKDSMAAQEMRRLKIEADLLRSHGHNAIRPYYILSAEAIYNTPLGTWLIKLLNLFPYDEWNVLYLPNDPATQAAMPGLPLHPRRTIAGIDRLMLAEITRFHERYMAAMRAPQSLMHDPQNHDAATRAMQDVVKLVQFEMPTQIMDMVTRASPAIIGMIAEAGGPIAG